MVRNGEKEGGWKRRREGGRVEEKERGREGGWKRRREGGREGGKRVSVFV